MTFFQELQLPPLGGLVGLEVESPDHVGPDRAERAHGLADAPQGLLALATGHTQDFCDPEAVDPLGFCPPSGRLGGQRRPQLGVLGQRRTKSRQKARSGSSSSEGTRAARRWVDLGWPSTRQARRSLTPNCVQRARTSRRRQSGVTTGGSAHGDPVTCLQSVATSSKRCFIVSPVRVQENSAARCGPRARSSLLLFLSCHSSAIARAIDSGSEFSATRAAAPRTSSTAGSGTTTSGAPQASASRLTRPKAS